MNDRAEINKLLAAIDERLARRGRSKTTIALIHKRELPLVQRALYYLLTHGSVSTLDGSYTTQTKLPNQS
jgi:hypothetical protein